MIHRQMVYFPMETNWTPLVVDLFLFCYERESMISPSDDNQALNSTSRYLDDLLNTDNLYYFEGMVNQIYRGAHWPSG